MKLNKLKLLKYFGTTILGMVSMTSYAQLSDTLYYKNGNIVPCNIQWLEDSMVVAYVRTNGDILLSKSVYKSWLDSMYRSNPRLLEGVSLKDNVGDNLILSGVSTMVSWLAVGIGLKVDKLNEGFIVASVASLVSVVGIINAGIIANREKRKTKEFNHIMVF